MKIMKYLTMGLLFIGMTALVGCKKEDMSKYVTKDELSQGEVDTKPKVEIVTFNLTFNQYTVSQLAPSSLGTKLVDNDNVLLLYIQNGELNGEPKWMQIPLVYGGISYSYERWKSTTTIYITKYNDATSSPLSSSTTFSFKAVVLPTTSIKANPDLDLSNFKEVSKAFDLE